MERFIDAFMGPTTNLVSQDDEIRDKEYKEWFIENVLKASQFNRVGEYDMFPGFGAEAADYAYDKLEYHSSDILVSTYAKTGTTWMTAIVQHIVYGRQPEILEKAAKVTQFFSYLEFGPASKYRVSENLPFPRRIFGTHLPESFVNMEKLKQKGVKIIYVTRNPKDRAVSFYNFVMSLPFMQNPGFKKLFPRNEREFYDTGIARKAKSPTGIIDDYLDSLKEWFKHKGEANFLIVSFEDLKKNPRTEVKKIAEFLGETLSEADIEDVVEKTSFRKMKQKTEGNKDSVKLFRKGEVGEWKDHLTVAQSELIDRKVEEMLKDTDIKFVYE